MGFLTNLVEQKQKQSSEDTLREAQKLRFLAENHPDPQIQGEATEGLIKAAGLSAKEGQNLLAFMGHLSKLSESGQSGAPSMPSSGETPPPSSGAGGNPPLPVQYVPDPHLQPTTFPQDLQRMTGAEGEGMERPPSEPVPVSPASRMAGPEAPPIAAPKKPGFWRSLGQVGLETLAGGLSGGKTVEEQYRKEEQERQAEVRRQELEQQAGIRRGELGYESQLRTQEAVNPQVRQAKIDDAVNTYVRQRQVDDQLNDIQAGKLKVRFDRYIHDEETKGAPIEDAIRRAAIRMNAESGKPSYAPPPAPPRGQIRIAPDDPSKPEGTYHYVEINADGTEVNRGPAPRPASGKPAQVPGRDIPFPPEVESQRIRERQAAAQAAIPEVPVIDTRPDAAEGNRINPQTGLTPNSIFQGGREYALTGRVPPMGLSARGAGQAGRTAIINSGAAQA